MPDGERESTRVTIGVPAADVWRALREPGEIEKWHGWHYDDLGAEIAEIFLADVVEDQSRMTLDTNGGGRFELDDLGARTCVRVVREADDPPDEIDEGWMTFVQQLRFLLERHPGRDRRTLRVDDDRPSTATVWALLGLETLVLNDGPGPGARYAVALPAADPVPGEALTGEIWFRSVHQLGLTVDGWDDGLLVVAEGLTSDEPGSVLVTTFGDDDTVFEQRRRAWQARWFAPGSGD